MKSRVTWNDLLCWAAILLVCVIFLAFQQWLHEREKEAIYAEQTAMWNAQSRETQRPIVIHEGIRFPDKIGFNNNNPGNIKRDPKGQKWKGEQDFDHFGHVIFDHWMNGLRAIAMNLKNAQHVRNRWTLNDIMEVYAEKNSAKYAKFLADRLGIKPTDELNVMLHMPALLKGIVIFENGSNPYPDWAFNVFAVYTEANF